MMDHIQRMTVGVACRRGMLALAAAALLALVWLGIEACRDVTAQSHRTFVLCDTVATPSVPASSQLCIIPPALERSSGQTLVYSSVLPAHFGGGGTVAGVNFGPAQAGVERGTVQGAPYGPYAFEKASAIIAGVRPQERVFLVDSRLAGSSAAGLKASVAAMSRLGIVAFVGSGPPAEFVESLAAIRRDLPPALVLPGAQARTRLEALQAALRGLRKTPPNVLYFVSQDEALVRQASRLGCKVVMIGAPTPKPLPDKVLQFPNLPALTDYLVSLAM
ncbi:MAG: hypothetical protein ABFD92_20525 [Planctomycetaceae bacterium]|nr:hypothetical protein [Planctomycetaceae bacterium]